MRAKIRWFHSPDVYDLEKYAPDDPEDVGVFIQVMVGDEDSPGEESFDLEVVTPKHLIEHVKRDGPLIGRGFVIVARWNWPEIRDFLTGAFESEQAPTWDELGERLGRIGHWEFEDYRELPQGDGT